jgi:DNA topoisomerase II
VTFPRGKLAELNESELEKLLKLTTTVSTSNMHLFDSKCKLHKYASIPEIIEAFSSVRLDTYHRRKAHQIRNLEEVLVKLSNRAKYIMCVLDGTIDLRRKSAEEIDAMLSGQGLVKIGETGYDYLVKMPMVSVSKENVERLLREKQETEMTLTTLRATTPEQMWQRELTEFESQYDLYVTKRQAEYVTSNTNSGKSTDTAKTKKVVAKK